MCDFLKSKTLPKVINTCWVWTLDMEKDCGLFLHTECPSHDYLDLTV